MPETSVRGIGFLFSLEDDETPPVIETTYCCYDCGNEDWESGGGCIFCDGAVAEQIYAGHYEAETCCTGGYLCGHKHPTAYDASRCLPAWPKPPGYSMAVIKWIRDEIITEKRLR